MSQSCPLKHQALNIEMERSESPSNILPSSEYDNEEFCFECKGIGTVICCDKCPKTFHEACLKAPKYRDVVSNTEFGETWTCPCCQLVQVCPSC